jgi:sensor histidine kinase YesM
MNWKFLVVFLFFLSFVASAMLANAGNKIDSLEQKLATLPDDSTKVSVLTKLNSEWSAVNPAKGIEYCRQAVELAKKIRWTKGIAVSYIGLGYTFGVWGNYDSALVYNDSAIVYSVKTRDKSRIALAYINRGSSYNEQKKLVLAQTDFLVALKYAEQSGNPDRLARAYTALGNVYYYQGNWKKAKENYLPAIELFDSIANVKMVAILEMNLGNCARRTGEYQESLHHYKKAEQLQKENEHVMDLMSTYMNMAVMYEELRDSINAVKNYELSYRLAKEYEDWEMVAINAAYLADFYMNKGEIQKGMEYSNEAYLSAKNQHLFEKQHNAASILARGYALQHDFANAYRLLQDAMALNDTILKSRQEQLLTEMQTRYETEKKEKENIVLKTENQLKEQKLEARTYMLTGTLIGIMLLFALVFAISRNYRNEKRNVALLDKLNSQLTLQRDEILQINHLLQLKVLRTQMNPHFIYNCLNAINNLVVKGENEKATSYLLNFARLLRMILDYSDKITIDLEDEITFLKLYLSLEAMRMGDEFSYEVVTDDQLEDDDISIPSLLVQPFIENAVWHGLINKQGEKKIRVSFGPTANGSAVLCIVEDNGIGRKKAMLNKNINGRYESKGIKITQERLELLQFQVKGQVSMIIKDHMGANGEPMGTSVELTLPVATMQVTA